MNKESINKIIVMSYEHVRNHLRFNTFHPKWWCHLKCCINKRLQWKAILLLVVKWW